MASLFATRFNTLARPAMFREFGVEVTYSNASHTASGIVALVSTTTFETMEGVGLVRLETRDYLIKVADLVLNGSLTTPARGDTIVESGKTYRVTSPSGQDSFAYEDEAQFMFRIHTVLVSA